MADITDLYLEAFTDQMEPKIYSRVFRANKLAALVDREEFDPTMGMNQKIVTLDGSRPTAYPTALTEVSRSTGTGDVSCNATATRIERGGIKREFEMVQQAFDTDTICVNDLQTGWNSGTMLQEFERVLAENMNIFLSDFYRITNLQMAPQKAAVLSGGTLSWASSSDYTANFSGLSTLPTGVLTWAHLRQIHERLLAQGLTDEYSIGTDSNGLPVLPLVCSMATIQRLTSETTIRDTVNYLDPASNLKALGINQSIYGFALILDLFPIRYGKFAVTTSSGTTYSSITSVGQITMAHSVYPSVAVDYTTDSDSLTFGKGSKVNPFYAPVANDGHTQYEVATIVPRGTWTMKVWPTAPSRYANAIFNPITYAGQVRWINNKTFRGDNDDGNKGYYRLDWRGGAAPARVDFGVALLQKAQS